MKKTVLFLLVIGLLFTLAACQKGGGELTEGPGCGDINPPTPETDTQPLPCSEHTQCPGCGDINPSNPETDDQPQTGAPIPTEWWRAFSGAGPC